MQEPQFSPVEADTLTPAERQALKQARGRPLRALFCCAGAGMLTLFAVGCPEPADLQDPGSFPRPPSAGGSTSTAGTTGTAGTTTVGEVTYTAFSATLLDDATQGAAQTTLGLGTGDSPTFVAVTVDTEVYGAGWNGDLTVPTKDAVYDKIETLSAGSGLTRGQTTAIAMGIV